MFYTMFEVACLFFGIFFKEPQLLIAAGAFAIAEELFAIESAIETKGSVDDGRKE